ncbi:MAG: hypothetical protein Q9169_005130 [Polycauliona sp. 2 TL-2023]
MVEYHNLDHLALLLLVFGQSEKPCKTLILGLGGGEASSVGVALLWIGDKKGLMNGHAVHAVYPDPVQSLSLATPGRPTKTHPTAAAAMNLQWIPPPSRFALQDDRAPSPSPSRSPQKRHGPATKLLDPLLSNLSPSSTLDALQASHSDLPPQDAFHESIAAASLSERSFAIRAATAGKRLKDWYQELQQWPWRSSHNPFESPSTPTPPTSSDDAGSTQEYWGSLAVQTVLQYENRIDEIRDAMNALELEDLKMHVRDAHTLSSHERMDDFTAIVTTTVLQALPLIYRLEALLSVWDSRLTVLRASPGFITTMDHAQQEMGAAWKVCNQETTAQALHEMKARLESQIRDLGYRLDHMLDTLEGRQDTIPDRWIDDMEQLEADFGDWTVEAEKTIVHLDMKLEDEAIRQKALIADRDQGLQIQSSNDTERPNDENDHPPPTNDISDTPKDSLHPHRPLPLNLRQHRRDHSNAYSDISTLSYPGSATSDYFSDMSSPEIQDASRAEYFGVGSPVEVTTPGLPRGESRTSEDTITRQSSQRTERGESAASTIIAEPTIEEDDSPAFFAISSANSVDTGYTTPSIPTKSRHRFEEVTDLSPTTAPVKIIRRKTATDTAASPNRNVTASPTKSDALEARISSILTDIPANIQLARSSDVDTKTAATPSVGKLNIKPTRKSPSPTPRLIRAQTAAPSPPSMTLIPASEKSSARNGESDVQLYHLHQSGQGPPIKLFIRLVGEGERVMVRIGGGWADLAEYLKEYANHHGRRTVSGGQFNIQGLPLHSQSSSPAPTLSSLSQHQTPVRTATGSTSKQRPDSNGSANHPSGYGSPSDGFRPTSRDSNASSKHSWTGDDSPSLGLAGPKSRKAVVSPNKQAWVDTMIEKARLGSSEKKKGAKDGFGDLGIIGGTKRVLSIDSIFEDYTVQSNTPGNTINLQVSLTHLNRALRSAINASSASIRLTKKDTLPLLAITITTTTLTSLRRPPTLEDGNNNPHEPSNPSSTFDINPTNNDSISLQDRPPASFQSDRETTITQSVAVIVLAPQTVSSIHEPTCREPDVHILLPPLLQLKAISERFTKLALPSSANIDDANQSTRIILSASPYGEFRIGVQTAACKIESKWQDLTNPELDPAQIEGGEEGLREHASTRQKSRRRDEAWSTVRVEGRDWGRVLGVGRLGGRVVACFCDDHALILYVYLENDENGADDSVLTGGLLY